MTTTPAAAKPLRVDAQRNYDAVLAAGKSVFARSGTDAPLEDIGREAGVGRGTLYRHFPTREHLFAAIMKERVDFLEATAQRLLGAPDAWEALTEWLSLYDQSFMEFGGMKDRIGHDADDDESPVTSMCAPMRSSFALLFDRAQKEAGVRSDITAVQVLGMITALPKHPQGGETVSPYLDIVFSGLRD
ncbi:MAG TPA: helix-turn-helix domain-containing protein [Acidimicrobiales bacterium]